jgi:Na+/H+ antiporter NhaA
VRTYLLTFALADDVAGIVVIALAYSGHLNLAALAAGLAILGVVIVVRQRGVRNGVVYLLLGVAAWVAFFQSGVDPVVVGLALGLLALARPVARTDLERAYESFRLFREQPTPELARGARESVRLAISPNDRLQQLFHPWTSYLIVPLFALANAGITVSGSFLARAYTSPVTLGILFGYVAGKPVGTVGAAWLLTRVTRGAIRPPVGWVAVTGAGVIAGIGFIVSLLIASLAFHGAQLAEAKVGILSAALCASVLGWAVFRITALLPKPLRARALLGTAEAIIDLAVPVEPGYDHVRGPGQAPSPWWNTATSNAPTAAAPNQSSVICWPATATCATHGGTCRSPTSTPTRWPRPRPPRPPPGRASSGRCTTSCSATRTR